MRYLQCSLEPTADIPAPGGWGKRLGIIIVWLRADRQKTRRLNERTKIRCHNIKGASDFTNLQSKLAVSGFWGKANTH